MQLFDEGNDVAELDGGLYEGQRLYMVTTPQAIDCHYAVRGAGQSIDDFEAEVGLAMRRRYGQRVRFDLADVTGAYRGDIDGTTDSGR